MDSEVGAHTPRSMGTMKKFLSRPWLQISLISIICFACPGMYNALSGLGGSGQVDPTTAANATTALLACTAGTALFLAGPVFDLIGPRNSLLIGGWTYALYSGSLLNLNRTGNGPFVIASGAILGVGASFLWVAQGSIMTSYVKESYKGRAIATFWIIFNLGGGIGSLASFGINYHNSAGTVSDSTYIALMVIMLFGWVLSLFICAPQVLDRNQNKEYSEVREEIKEKNSLKNLLDVTRLAKMLGSMVRTLSDWRIAVLLPLFFCANVFYSYQQNEVNGMTFNIRTRSLNGALYWIAQMAGGLVMGLILDMPKVNRRNRAICGWVFLLVTGMVIWGGGLSFERWNEARQARGLKQDIDFQDGSIFLGPMFLYIFYGAYDAFWQSFCYWMIGAKTNDPSISAILVGAYKTFQSTGGAMAWRVNAIHASSMTQFAMNWGLCIGALFVAIPAVVTVTMTNAEPAQPEHHDEVEAQAYTVEEKS